MSFNFRDARLDIIRFEPFLSLPSSGVPSGTSGPENGSVWIDAGQRSLARRVSGAQLFDVGVLNVQTATAAQISNATAETTLFSFTLNPDATTFQASSLPINVLNKVVRIWCRGQVVTAAVQTPTVTFRARLGGLTGTLITSVVSPATVASTTSGFVYQADLIVNAIGSAGTVEGGSQAILNAVSGAADTASASSAALDLTVSQALVVTAAMSTAAAGNTLTARQFVVEALN